MRLDEPTVRVKLVGEELRRYREALGLTLDQVADRIGISKSKLSRMETGSYGQRCDEVAGLLAIYGVKGQDRAEILDLTRHAHQYGLWQRIPPSVPQRIAALKILESQATRIISFECELIPGLLQTVPYAQAVIRHVGMLDDDEILNERVAARIRRQGVLRKSRAPQFTAIVAENALHNVIGDKTVMRGQLMYLTEVASRPNIILRIIPRSMGNHSGFDGPFHMIQFHGRPAVVVLANRTASAYLEEDEDRLFYNNVLVDLLRVALSPEESLALVRDLETRLA